MQTEILTDYILALLVEQMKHNMFPRRAVIPKSSSESLNNLVIHDNHSLNSDSGLDAEDLKQEEMSLLSSIRSDTTPH